MALHLESSHAFKDEVYSRPIKGLEQYDYLFLEDKKSFEVGHLMKDAYGTKLAVSSCFTDIAEFGGSSVKRFDLEEYFAPLKVYFLGGFPATWDGNRLSLLVFWGLKCSCCGNLFLCGELLPLDFGESSYEEMVGLIELAIEEDIFDLSPHPRCYHCEFKNSVERVLED